MRFLSAVSPSSNHAHAPIPNAKGTIIYTETDEAPALATYSLYPVIKKVRVHSMRCGCAVTTSPCGYLSHIIHRNLNV